MNMQQSLLEAIHSVEEIDRLSPDQALAELKTYVFPMNAVKDIQSSAIRDMVDNNKPVTFLWAATEFADKAKSARRDPKFLFDLGRSLLPEQNGTSMFFAHANNREAEYNKSAYRLVSQMKGGPIVFELFRQIAGSELFKLDETFQTTIQDDGTSVTQKNETDVGLRDAMGKYYQVLEKALEKTAPFVSQRTTTTEYSEYSDAVLYGAYLGYIFQVFNLARKPISETDGTKLDRVPIATVFNRGARNVAKTAVSVIPASSTGALNKSGSIYNDRKSAKRVIEPSRLSNENLSEISVYPKYVIDVLKLTPDTAKNFRNILRNHGYDSIADALEHVTSVKDTAMLDISTASFIDMLNDQDVIKECNNFIPDIFKKYGNTWVDARGNSSLNSVLALKPAVQNSDDKDSRAVAVAMKSLVKRSNTEREFIGDNIIPDTHITMTIGEAAVVKDLTQKALDAELERRKRDGLSFGEYVEELKAASRDENNLNKNIKKAFRHTGPDAEAAIVFDTKDGRHHTIRVSDDIDEKLDNIDLENVIVRKQKAGGDTHSYFISIPHGIVFATMQDDEGTIVRNENMDTLCMGLKRNGDDVHYRSVNDLMDSPIGKYCHAIVSDGKTGRIRFSSDKANSAYGKVLDGLKDMKAHGQSFNPTGVANMVDAIKWMTSVLKFKKVPVNEIKDTLGVFMEKDLVLSVETYSTKTGKFVFRPINRTHRAAMARKLIKHLSDMYNLDTTVNGYNSDDVKNVLEVVVPKGSGSSGWRWDLSNWNYGNVLRAYSVLNGTSSDINVEDPDVDVEGNGYEGEEETGQVFDDNLNSQTGYNGDVDDSVSDDTEIGSEGIGGEDIKAARIAWDNAFEETFADYDTLPPTQQKALVNDVNKTNALRDNLASTLHSMWKGGSLEINLEPDVRGIQCNNVKELRTEFWKVVDNAVDNKPSSTDDSIRMRAFFDDDEEALSGGSVEDVKTILKSALDTNDATDNILIPEMGSLMFKYAMDEAVANKDFDAAFNRETLVSSFEDNFKNEAQSKADEIGRLEDLLQSDEDVDMEKVEEKKDAASREYLVYQKIQEKINTDPSYVSKVADVVLKKLSRIVSATNGMPTDIHKPYSPFDGGVVGTDAGNAIVDFCTYDTEGQTSTENTRRLNDAFSNGPVKSMMQDLFYSVPKDCLSIDYGTVDTKTSRELNLNEIQMLESYYSKSDMHKSFAGLTNLIKDVYSQNDPVHSLFGYEEGADTNTPYAYMYNGKPVDLKEVKGFFDMLIKLADSYNVIGHSDSTESQELVQQTINNTIQRSKVLTNRHFKKLYAGFTSFYNALLEGRQLSADEQADFKNVVNKVLTQVVSNPMNVLINNNARLISAYAYYVEIVKAQKRTLSASGKEFGHGTGVGNIDSVKEFSKENNLLGRNDNVDATVPNYKVAEGVAHSQYIKNKIDASGVDLEQAKTDYNNYLKDFGDGADAVDILKRVLKAPGKLEDNIYLEKQKTDLFCNYGVDYGSKDAADVAKLRENELIVLLYNTAADIVNFRSKFGSTKELVSKLSSQAPLLKSGNFELVSKKLLDTFVNIGAELQLANNAEYQKIVAAASNPDDEDPKEIKSPNNQIKNAINMTRGFDSIPKNKTDELVDTLLSDKEVDNKAMQKAIVGMDRAGRAGDKKSGSSIKLDAQLDVVSADANDMLIRSRTINLYENDYIVIRASSGLALRQVSKVVNGNNKEYNIAPVAGLMKGDTKIPFARFQARNEFDGVDLRSKLPAVVHKMSQWYNKYKGNDQTVPSNIMTNVCTLKMLYTGSNGSEMMKSIVSYLAWRISHFDYSFKPEKLSFAGGDNKEEAFIVRIIVADLNSFGPNGENEDKVTYKNIMSVLPDGFDRIAESHHLQIVTTRPEQIRQAGQNVRHNVQVSSLNLDTKNALKEIVDVAGQYSGYVKPQYIQKFMQTKKLYEKLNLTDDDAKKWVAAIGDNGKLKSMLDDVIKEHNWGIAKPLIDAYKQNNDNPTFEGAIQYIKDNYDIKMTDNSQEFANYIKEKCASDVRDSIQ